MSCMHDNRINRVIEEMNKVGIGQLLVNDPQSIFYLTGVNVEPFERFFAFLITTDGQHKLFVNVMFALENTGFDTVTLVDTDDVAAKVVPYLTEGELGVDKNLPARFLLPILDAFPELSAVLGSDCVDNVRACKDETEKQLMRRASEINDICVEKVAAFIHDGVTEKECVDYLLALYKEYGCEGPSFDPIVSFGGNASDPHHVADDTVIKEGDCIVIDIGCKKDGYCSDMTRTYFWKKADPQYLSIYNTVLEANIKAEEMIHAGVPLCELDLAARNHISEAGYGKFFTHRLGHFIGMETHEKGDVSSVSKLIAKEGMIFSVEPGVYLPGEFGVRIEDLVIVTADGCEKLNKVSKEVRILG